MADAPRAAWWARYPVEEGAGRPASREWVAVRGPQFPPASVVDHPPGRRPAGWLIAARASVTGDRVHSIETALPDVPLLWYVELDEPDATPPARTVVAFSDSRYAEGTVLTGAEARAAGVDGGRQVAALRWWPGTGLVHQIYVAPAFRRRGLALKLVTAASSLQVVRGLPPMHGDGRRTDDGEAWVGGLPGWAARRFAPRTEVLPSMTPA